jgi:hypothetical protein
MEKVVPFFKSFKSIFYFEFLEFGKTGFHSIQSGTDLKFIPKFVFNLNPTALHVSRPSSLSFPASWAPPPGRSTHTNSARLSLCHGAPIRGPTHRPAHPLSPFSLFPCLPRVRPGAAVPGLSPPDHAPLMFGTPSSSACHGWAPSCSSTWPHDDRTPPQIFSPPFGQRPSAPPRGFLPPELHLPAKPLPLLPSSFCNESPPSLLAPVSSVHRISNPSGTVVAFRWAAVPPHFPLKVSCAA